MRTGDHSGRPATSLTAGEAAAPESPVALQAPSALQHQARTSDDNAALRPPDWGHHRHHRAAALCAGRRRCRSHSVGTGMSATMY